MANSFHEKPYDSGTLTKLKIFELYAQEWIPVFVSQSDPRFRELHIFDLFCGPGYDSNGVPGSPLRILAQLRGYQKAGMAGWSKININVHFSDSEAHTVHRLEKTLKAAEWQMPGVNIKTKIIRFNEALELHAGTLSNRHLAKLLIIDQFGVDAVTDKVFERLVDLPTADFIFFLSSSTLNRFRDHPAIKIKIDRPEDSYDVHRAAFDWFRNLAPPEVFLGKFSIRKRSNIYGLIFGSRHQLGIHKFLQVAWNHDEIRGEANFDIDREDIQPDRPMLPMDEFRPKKIQVFESDLEKAIRSGEIQSEAELIRFSIESGMTCQHCTPILQKLKREGTIDCDFRTPNIRNFKKPRPLTLRSST